ncbi:hypothetical protein D3C87_1009080 [compost metagenome]
MTNVKTECERVENLSMFSIDLTQKIRSLIDVLGPYAPLAKALSEYPDALIVKAQVKLRGSSNCHYEVTFQTGEILIDVFVTDRDVMHYIANRFNKAVFGTSDIYHFAEISFDGVTIDPVGSAHPID